jgi:branched-chain amino acid transport system substrate-binding protein
VTPAIVTSVPLSGAVAGAGSDAAAAAQLALDDAGAPAEHRVLDAGPGLEGRHVAANARAALADDGVVAYLGDFHSISSLLSLPILEAGGLPQVSFANTFRGLAGTSYFNVMPDDEALAADLAGWMLELGVEDLYLLSVGEGYGLDMRLLVHRAWAAAGRRVAGASRLDDVADLPGDLERPHAVFLGAVAEPGAAAVLRDVNRRAPEALLFGMDGLAVDGFVGTLPGPVRSRLRIGSAALRGERLPAPGREVRTRLRAALGHEPDAHAIYAYEAMSLVLGALAAAGPDREAITRTLRAPRDRDSVLGRYSFTALGATTLGAGGRLVAAGSRLVPA